MINNPIGQRPTGQLDLEQEEVDGPPQSAGIKRVTSLQVQPLQSDVRQAQHEDPARAGPHRRTAVQGELAHHEVFVHAK